MIGIVTELCTKATICAEFDIETINQAAPTDCITAPKFETSIAIQIARKTGWRNGANGLCGTDCGVTRLRSMSCLQLVEGHILIHANFAWHAKHTLRNLVFEHFISTTRNPHHGGPDIVIMD
jgi:hypothetical protein